MTHTNDPRPLDAAPDPARCPLCGEPNACAMETARRTGQAASSCWCVQARFSPELLARVPAAAQRLACICARCAGARSDA